MAHITGTVQEVVNIVRALSDALRPGSMTFPVTGISFHNAFGVMAEHNESEDDWGHPKDVSVAAYVADDGRSIIDVYVNDHGAENDPAFSTVNKDGILFVGLTLWEQED